jgi:hypothetical protein
VILSPKNEVLTSGCPFRIPLQNPSESSGCPFRIPLQNPVPSESFRILQNLSLQNPSIPSESSESLSFRIPSESEFHEAIGLGTELQANGFFVAYQAGLAGGLGTAVANGTGEKVQLHLRQRLDQSTAVEEKAETAPAKREAPKNGIR